ncbi:MAG: hypothetical protein QXG05_08010 [Nitrososphaerota archaeon]
MVNLKKEMRRERQRRIKELLDRTRGLPTQAIHESVIKYAQSRWLVTRQTAEDYYEVVKTILQQEITTNEYS